MHACQLLYFSLLAAISYASSGCQKDPYEPISQVEFGYLKGLLSRYVRPMPAGDFTKQSPRKSDFRKRDMPPQGTGNLGFADDGPFCQSPYHANLIALLSLNSVNLYHASRRKR